MKTATAVSFVSFSCLWRLLRRAHVDSALGCHLDAQALCKSAVCETLYYMYFLWTTVNSSKTLKPLLGTVMTSIYIQFTATRNPHHPLRLTNIAKN